MKNADLPAMPVTDEFGMPFNSVPEGLCTIGLTKREVMAMHAPEVPEWFNFKWRDENKSNAVFFTQLHEGRSGLVAITHAGHVAMYFSWRTYYADSLLAELERTNGQ